MHEMHEVHEVHEEDLPLEHEMTQLLGELQRAVQGPIVTGDQRRLGYPQRITG